MFNRKKWIHRDRKRTLKHKRSCFSMRTYVAPMAMPHWPCFANFNVLWHCLVTLFGINSAIANDDHVLEKIFRWDDM